MTNTAAAIAESFSRHRFAETFPHLADDVRWVAVGQVTMQGRQAVIDACEAATAATADLSRSRRTPSNYRRSDHVPQ